VVVERDVRFTHSAVRSEGHSERTSLEASEGGERYSRINGIGYTVTLAPDQQLINLFVICNIRNMQSRR